MNPLIIELLEASLTIEALNPIIATKEKIIIALGNGQLAKITLN